MQWSTAVSSGIHNHSTRGKISEANREMQLVHRTITIMVPLIWVEVGQCDDISDIVHLLLSLSTNKHPYLKSQYLPQLCQSNPHAIRQAMA